MDGQTRRFGAGCEASAHDIYGERHVSMCDPAYEGAFIVDSDDVRALAAWLLEAADWLEG